MLMAAFGDVHGNLPALEAVLHALEEEGIETVACTGDMVVGMPFVNEVIDVVRRETIPMVQGEMDRLATLFVKKAKTIARKRADVEVEHLRWTYEQMRSEHLEFLQAVPKHRTMTVDGYSVYVCHGSPTGQTDSLLEEDSLERFRRQREVANTNIVVCGRTHRPFARLVEGTLFVNPGSVGVEVGCAMYAVISTEEEPWSAEIRTLEYDATTLRERLREWGLSPLWETA